MFTLSEKLGSLGLDEDTVTQAQLEAAKEEIVSEVKAFVMNEQKATRGKEQDPNVYDSFQRGLYVISSKIHDL